MKKLIVFLSLVTLSFSQVQQQDSVQTQVDNFIKESERITGNITKLIVQKDLTIQQLITNNVQMSKELQKLQQELNSRKKDTSKTSK
jgi:hypothetical protein